MVKFHRGELDADDPASVVSRSDEFDFLRGKRDLSHHRGSGLFPPAHPFPSPTRMQQIHVPYYRRRPYLRQKTCNLLSDSTSPLSRVANTLERVRAETQMSSRCRSPCLKRSSCGDKSVSRPAPPTGDPCSHAVLLDENPTLYEDSPAIPGENNHDDLPPLALSTNPLYPNAIVKRPPNTHAKTSQRTKAPPGPSAPKVVTGKNAPVCTSVMITFRQVADLSPPRIACRPAEALDGAWSLQMPRPACRS